MKYLISFMIGFLTTYFSVLGICYAVWDYIADGTNTIILVQSFCTGILITLYRWCCEKC